MARCMVVLLLRYPIHPVLLVQYLLSLWSRHGCLATCSSFLLQDTRLNRYSDCERIFVPSLSLALDCSCGPCFTRRLPMPLVLLTLHLIVPTGTTCLRCFCLHDHCGSFARSSYHAPGFCWCAYAQASLPLLIIRQSHRCDITDG